MDAGYRMFSGSIPALVTPFAADGSFDETAYRDFVEWQIAEGSSGLVACGTTGEAATLSYDEHFHVVRVCVEAEISDAFGAFVRNASRASNTGRRAALVHTNCRCAAPVWPAHSSASIRAS